MLDQAGIPERLLVAMVEMDKLLYGYKEAGS